METHPAGVRAWGTHSCPFVWRFLWHTERPIMSLPGTHIPECSKSNYPITLTYVFVVYDHTYQYYHLIDFPV